MDKAEQYIREISQLVEVYGLATMQKLLTTSDRAIQYWVAGEKVPRASTRLKISELFEQHKSGYDLRKVNHESENGYKDKYIDMLERENSRLISQVETNLKTLEELKSIVSENFALLSSLRYAAALILLNQRKGLIRDLSQKEVSDLVSIAGMLDKVVADALNLSPKTDKIHESIR